MSKISKIFGGGKVDTPPPPPPLPPKITDPAIDEAKKKSKSDELKRKGRRSAVLTSGAGVEEDLGSVSRPGATQLGG